MSFAIPSIDLYNKLPAAMAELADALDSGSSRGNSVEVQVLLAATFSSALSQKFLMQFRA